MSFRHPTRDTECVAELIFNRLDALDESNNRTDHLQLCLHWAPICEGYAEQLRTGYISVVQELMLFKRLYFNDNLGSVVPLENKGSVTRAHFTHGEQTKWRLFEAP